MEPEESEYKPLQPPRLPRPGMGACAGLGRSGEVVGSASLSLLLIMMMLMVCVALGALLAWCLNERQERVRLAARAQDAEKACIVALARQDDLGHLLTDPHTEFFRLRGKQAAAGRSLTILWQEQTAQGFLVGESIPLAPDSMHYVIWRVTDQPKVAGAFSAAPGITCVPLCTAGAARPAGAGQFLVSLESSRNPRVPPGPANSSGPAGPILFTTSTEP